MPPKTAIPVAAATTVASSTLIEKCCLIAQPVAGDPTHFMIEQAFALSGLDWRFMSFEVAPDRLGDAMRGIRALGFRGVKVAEPHQETVIEYLEFFASAYRINGPGRRKVCEDKLELVDMAFKRDAMVNQLSRGQTQRIGLARVFQGLFEALGVFAAVFEFQRVDGQHFLTDLVAAFSVEEHVQAVARAHAVVVAASGADVVVGLQVALVEHGFAAGAFHPQTFRHAAAVCGVGVLNFWGQQFFEPTHEGLPWAPSARRSLAAAGSPPPRYCAPPEPGQSRTPPAWAR